MNKQDVEPQVAEALLDVGVSIPLWRFHLPFRKKPVQLRMTMKRPKLGTQLRIARLYLKIGVTYEKMRDFTKEEQMSFMVEHGHDVCRMIALTIVGADIPVCFYLLWYHGYCFGGWMMFICKPPVPVLFPFWEPNLSRILSDQRRRRIRQSR